MTQRGEHARYYWLLLAESHLTRRLFADRLRKIAALPSPAGQGERRAEQISMTTLGRREKCLRNHSPRVALPAGGETGPSRRRWKHSWTKTRLNPCRGRLSGIYIELELERQNGNSCLTRAPRSILARPKEPVARFASIVSYRPLKPRALVDTERRRSK